MMIKIKLDWNKEVKEKTEEEQLKELKIKKKYWKKGYSKDGFIEIWRKKYKYKGIAFELAILRYYDLTTNKFKPINNRKCDKHCVVEYPEETKKLKNKIDELEYNEFLYHDTLHSWNDKQTLNEQLQYAYITAIEDINNIPSILKTQLNKIKEIKKILKELRK